MKLRYFILGPIALVIALLIIGLSFLNWRGPFAFREYEHRSQTLYWVNAAPFIGGIYAGAANGGQAAQKIAFNPYSPDAIAVDTQQKQLYFTNMTLLDDDDGNIMRASITGTTLSQFETVIPNGLGLKTPKQLVISMQQQLLYFADREGQRIYRAPMQGIKTADELEILVDFSQLPETQHQFVGIAIDEHQGQFYWTDRLTNTIWRAPIQLSQTITPNNIAQIADKILQYDMGMLLEIDIDHKNNLLYFSDRGEGNEFFGETLPAGFIGRVNLNRLDGQYEVVIGNLLKDPVGLALDESNGVLYYSTSEDCKVFRYDLSSQQNQQIHQGRPLCEGMAFVDWNQTE